MTDNIFGNMSDAETRQRMNGESKRGVQHLFHRNPLDPEPGKPIKLYLRTAGVDLYDFARCCFTINRNDSLSVDSSTMDMNRETLEWDVMTWSYIQTWVVSIPPQPKKTMLRYTLEAHRVDTNEWIPAVSGSEVGATRYFSLWVDNDPTPDWAKQAIIYQVFPDRFYPGDNRSWNEVSSLRDFYGGTLQGVIDKLGYIQNLGFNTIWLNPFFKTNSHHGYNASDYYQVEPRLGTNQILKNLIREMHSRGMRLVLDFVANHWSKDHFTFVEAQNDRQSPYHDWYYWKQWPNDYECYFDVRELPKINLNFEPARKYMLEVARYWLREGFDGFRLDYAYGPTHDFWVDFRRACREVNPECWIFGEIIHTVPMLNSYTGIMDGTLDFHLANAMRKTFGQMKMPVPEFEAFLFLHEAYFPKNHIRPAFLDNHDEERFLFLAGNNKKRLQLAALLLYTLEGPPIVYCGTETGLSQERPMEQNGKNIFEECRLPMNWDNVDSSLQSYFTQLGKIRKDYPVLVRGSRCLMHLDPENGTYGYMRVDNDRRVLILFNLNSKIQIVKVSAACSTNCHDILNMNKVITRGNELEIELSPETGAFIPLS